MTEQNYAGYKEYNDSSTIQVEARYSVSPDRLFDKRTDTSPEKTKKNEWLEEYLDTSIFKKNQAEQ